MHGSDQRTLGGRESQPTGLGGASAQWMGVADPLAGMAVQAITAVEHNRAFSGGFQILHQLLGDPCGAMPDHQHISAHGHVGARGIQHALTLAQGAA